MAHQNPIFDLGSQSMLRIIRSARSRLGREHSAEPREDDKAQSRAQTGTSQLSGDRASKRSSLSRSAFGRHRLPRTSGCENAAPEKTQQLPSFGGSVLSDVTNISVVPSGDTDNHTKPPLSEPVSDPSTREGPSTVASTISSSDYFECDTQNASDPQYVMEYMPDIFRALQREEALHMASPCYMDRQANVNAKMRGILVDWLVSVQQKYKLKAETLFLAVSLIDRYLELKVTARRNLQLVGITSLLIAAKFEEIYPPHITDFVYVTDKAYTRDEIIKMEVLILSALDFKICKPTANVFLERYQTVNGGNDTHRDLAQYLLELTLPDYNMIKYSPSHLAAAAVLLSNKLMRRQPSWKPAAVKQTHLTEQMLKECAKEMCALLEHAETNSLQAIRKKFSLPKYNSVAKLTFTGGPSATPTAEEERGKTSRPSIGGERRRSIGLSEPGAPNPQVSNNLLEKIGGVAAL